MVETKNAPVVVFAYNRKDKIERCIESLRNCDLSDETDIIIYSDGAKSKEHESAVLEVRAYLETIEHSGCFNSVSLTLRGCNYGLQKSIIEGVTEVISQYKKVIVVEDDLILARDFLRYMNDALNYYEGLKAYGSVNAYSYPIKGLKTYGKDVYVTRKADCWGWGTWYDRWIEVDWDVKDFDSYKRSALKRLRFNSLESGLDKMLIAQQEGKISSWAVRWVYSLYKRGLLSVYPKISRAKNGGNDGSGVHGGVDDRYNCILSDGQSDCMFEALEINRKLEHQCARFPARRLKDYYFSIKRKLGLPEGK